MDEKFFRLLYLIRRVEEEIARIYPTDKIQSPVHLSIGQEAVSVGVCEALTLDDAVFGTYRSHALYLSKGASLKKLLCELYGKADGCSKGKGGSMHLAGAEYGFMGSSGVVASTISHAVGYAYALKLKDKKDIAVSFFGDGAVEEGVFFESINFAALKKLPVLFICENNGLAVHSRQNERQAVCNISEKVFKFGIPVDQIDGQDVHALYKRTAEVLTHMREGDYGPHFFECHTSRWREHVGPGEDFKAGYRSLEEVLPWMETDTLVQLRKSIAREKIQRIEAEVERQIKEAFAEAEKSPLPEEEELFTDVIKEY